MKYVVLNIKHCLLYHFGTGAYLTNIPNHATRFNNVELAQEVVESYAFGPFVTIISEDESSIIEIISQ